MEQANTKGCVVSTWIRIVAALVLPAGLWGGPCLAAELKVFSDGPLQTALAQIVPGFRSETGHDVVVVYGSAPALKAKLAAGEKADVLISLAPDVSDLARARKIASVQASVASVKLALAVRHGTSIPDIKT